jgi:hypothetical protein
MTSKKVLLGVGLLAALAIVYFAFEGYPPSNEGMEGAIGVAKRYRAEQINTEDVLLQDPEVQALLQSDTFYKLITDKEFQESVANEAITLLLMPAIAQDEEAKAELNKTADLLTALNDDEVKGLIAEGRYEEAVEVMNKGGNPGGKNQIADLGKGGNPDGKNQIADLGKGGNPGGKNQIADLGKGGNPDGKNQIADLGKGGNPGGKNQIADLGKGGNPGGKWTIADMQRLSNFAGARNWSASDLKKAESVLRMEGFQKLANVGQFQRLITSSPAFYQAMSDGNAKAFLSQAGVGE